MNHIFRRINTLTVNTNTCFEIDGFRSLFDFKIELSNGLNVLVGPNGSGKTNFIEFLDFLGNFIDSGASTAISQSGGLSRVFSVENLKKKSPKISCNVSGVADLNNSFHYRRYEQLGLPYFYFKYDLEIKFNKKSSAVFVSKEIIRFYGLSRTPEAARKSSIVGGIKLVRKGPTSTFEQVVEVGPRLKKKQYNNPLNLQLGIKKHDTMEDVFHKISLQDCEPHLSMLAGRPRLPAFDAIKALLGRGRSFNILPDVIRQSDDLTSYPTIKSNGEGLSATLFYLKKQKLGDVNHGYYLGTSAHDSFDMILHWAEMIFPELKDIIATQDIDTGKFVISVSIGDEKTIKLPLRSLSDGTVKWLALVTLMVLPSSPSSFEEPENFLHPYMQKVLVDIINDNVSDNDPGKFFILSTHSETIVNSCLPSDLVIFKFQNNRTEASRIENVEDVIKEINKTGFGLGYYYASGAIA